MFLSFFSTSLRCFSMLQGPSCLPTVLLGLFHCAPELRKGPEPLGASQVLMGQHYQAGGPGIWRLQKLLTFFASKRTVKTTCPCEVKNIKKNTNTLKIKIEKFKSFLGSRRFVPMVGFLSSPGFATVPSARWWCLSNGVTATGCAQPTGRAVGGPSPRGDGSTVGCSAALDPCPAPSS